MRDPFVGDTQLCPILCTGWNIEFFASINAFNFDFSTECGLGKRNSGRCNEIVSVALETFVLCDIDDDK